MTEAKNPFSHEEVSELLEYDPVTGRIFWKVNRSGVKAGSEAGYVSKHRNGKKYRIVKLYGTRCFAHRLAWLLHTKRWPADQIDHVNGDGLDNRLDNIREVTLSENARNRRMLDSNTSGAVGVCWESKRQKWVAQIWVQGKATKIGRFVSFEDAVKARKDAQEEREYHENHGKKRPL